LFIHHLKNEQNEQIILTEQKERLQNRQEIGTLNKRKKYPLLFQGQTQNRESLSSYF